MGLVGVGNPNREWGDGSRGAGVTWWGMGMCVMRMVLRQSDLHLEGARIIHGHV